MSNFVVIGNDVFRHSKITRDQWTDGPTDRHDLLKRCVVTTKNELLGGFPWGETNAIDRPCWYYICRNQNIENIVFSRDGRTDGRTDRWIDGRTNSLTNGRTDQPTDEPINRRSDGHDLLQWCMVASKNSQICCSKLTGRTDRQTDEWTDGRLSRQTDGLTDGQTDEKTQPLIERRSFI